MGVPFNQKKTLGKELGANLKAVFAQWRWLLHIAVWIILIVAVQTIGEFNFAKPFSGFFLSLVTCAAGFSYVFILLIVPLSYYFKRFWPIMAGVPINLFIWWAVLFIWRAHYYHIHAKGIPAIYIAKPGFILGYSLGQLIIMFWGFLACYYFIDLYYQQKNLTRYQNALTDKLKAELIFLQQQINPHFLFNTLNNIYLLLLKQNKDASIVINRLKALLQYMLNECTIDEVPLAGEVDFLKNYISLEQMRTHDREVNVDFVTDGDLNGKMIAPLLLINFVENAFKHGVKGGVGQASISILLKVDSNKLIFEVSNRKLLLQDTAQLAVKSASGIGIANVRRRLQILYPSRHELIITETNSTYNIHLNLTLA